MGRRTSGHADASQRVYRRSEEDSAARYNDGEVQSGPQAQADASVQAGTDLRVCRHGTAGRSGTCRARAELVGWGRPCVVTFCRRKELDQLTLVGHRPSSLVPSIYRRGPPTGWGVTCLRAVVSRKCGQWPLWFRGVVVGASAGARASRGASTPHPARLHPGAAVPVAQCVHARLPGRLGQEFGDSCACRQEICGPHS